MYDYAELCTIIHNCELTGSDPPTAGMCRAGSCRFVPSVGPRSSEPCDFVPHRRDNRLFSCQFVPNYSDNVTSSCHFVPWSVNQTFRCFGLLD